MRTSIICLAAASISSVLALQATTTVRQFFIHPVLVSNSQLISVTTMARKELVVAGQQLEVICSAGR
jgi:hypothetical protein